MGDGLRVVDGPPALEDYRRLRAESGLSPQTLVQANEGLHGAWAAIHVVDVATGETVGMGRVLGDGG